MKVLPASRSMALLVVLSAAAEAQVAQKEFRELAVKGAATPLQYGIVVPKGFAADGWYPLMFAMPGGAQDRAAVDSELAPWWEGLGAPGWIVVSPVCKDREADLPALLTHLRQTFRIDQGGMHLAASDSVGVASMWRLATTQPHEFQTLTARVPEVPEDIAPFARLRGRRLMLLAAGTDPQAAAAVRGKAAALKRLGVDALVVGMLAESDDPEVIAGHCQRVHSLRAEKGACADVARALDDFHDAAAKGDEERYFALLPDDAVFLGTDATERWTGAAFRKFALPYFERGPAWTYVAFRRRITLAPDGKIAWFDEALDNEAYGECRGSGVLELRDGRWVVRQYNLTIPVPNDLARGFVDRIRSFAEGRAPAVTTVVIVRHAEKGEGEDPELTDAGKARASVLATALGSLPVAAVYTSEFRRTAATVAPLCAARKVEPKVVPAADAKALAARIRKEHLGQTVVVAGHSNTVGPLCKALGVAGEVKIADDQFDQLFVVTLGPDGARLLELHYGGR